MLRRIVDRWLCEKFGHRWVLIAPDGTRGCKRKWCFALLRESDAQAVERPTMRQDLRSLLVKVYEASADGEGIESCCGGKHFKTTLMAGDRIYRLSYADAKEFDTNSAASTGDEK